MNFGGKIHPTAPGMVSSFPIEQRPFASEGNCSWFNGLCKAYDTLNHLRAKRQWAFWGAGELLVCSRPDSGRQALGGELGFWPLPDLERCRCGFGGRRNFLAGARGGE